MIIIREKKNNLPFDEAYIRGNFNPEIMVLEILKNSKPTIREANLLILSKFLVDNLEDGVPITETFITPNGANDVGEVQRFDKQLIAVSGVGERSPYDFAVNEIAKVYQVSFGSGTGFFCMGKKHNSIYLRDY